MVSKKGCKTENTVFICAILGYKIYRLSFSISVLICTSMNLVKLKLGHTKRNTENDVKRI